MSHRRYFCLLTALVLSLTLASEAADENKIESHLRKALEGKTALLRNFYRGNRLEYMANGELVGTADSGTWFSDGGLKIRKIELREGLLKIEGERVLQFYLQDGSAAATLGGEKIRISAALPTDASEEEIAALVTKILYRQGELKLSGPPGQVAVYRVGAGVKLPRAIYTPEPSYPENARQQRLQGSVVYLAVIDAKGRIATLQIKRGLGSGFDEAGVRTLSGWRFAPATTLNGNPVPVTINIEINFRLR